MRFNFAVAVFTAASFAVSASFADDGSQGHEGARAALDTLVAGLVAGEQVGDSARRGAILRVNAAQDRFVHVAAAGRARADAPDRMSEDRPFYIASITKPMVAVRVLQLAESGQLSLDTTLGQAGILPDDALDRLHVFEGRSYGAAITVRQLLQHRSGLRDMLLDDRQHLSTDSESGIAPGSIGALWSGQLDRFLRCRREPAACAAGELRTLYPGHRWKPFDVDAWRRNPRDRDAGLMNFFLSEMDRAGLFPPGTAFHYADTNYILLGMLIEKLSGRSLHAELRDAVFKPLAMDHTYLSYAPDADARPKGVAPADFWVGDVAVVSNDLDVSFDWAGGGVVTTAADLDRFVRGIASGKVFRTAASRSAMLDCVETPAREGRSGGYGLGIRCLETPYGPMWGHHGAWGSVMVYYPDHDVSVTGTVNRLFDHAGMEALTFGSMAALETAGLISRTTP